MMDEGRSTQRELDKAYIQLGATAQVVVRILDGLIEGVTNVAVALSNVGPGHARADLIANSEKLLEAVQRAKINRSDREGKVLLGLPRHGDEPATHSEWLRSVRSVDGNSDWLAAACRYGMARQDGLRMVAAEVATALCTIDQPEAQAYAARLRDVAAKVVSSPIGKGD
jgi:hypothetical protein